MRENPSEKGEMNEEGWKQHAEENYVSLKNISSDFNQIEHSFEMILMAYTHNNFLFLEQNMPLAADGNGFHKKN